jgi:Major Facilitator Superfamily
MRSISLLLLLNRILCAPLEIVFTLLIFILSKNLNAWPLYLTLIACIKPVSSFFAFYANSVIIDNPQRIRPYLLINCLAGSLPCLFFPCVENIWFYIASYAVFMISIRAVYPAWVEIMKKNLQGEVLSKMVSKWTSIHYAITIFLPLVICYWMDQNEEIWRLLFMGFALLQLLSIAVIFFIPTDAKMMARKAVVNPLREGWKILKKEPGFRHYQLLFFLGGAGIIGSQSILPTYFKENLNLSYTMIGMAFSFCKGVSFILTSPLWAKWANKLSIYHLNCCVNLCTTLFFLFILAANEEINWLFVAYLFYGTMQAGCEMSWNLSGPIFSGRDESTIYSSLNLAVVGIRGVICPALGYLLFVYTGAEVVFVVCGLVCFAGIPYGLWVDRKFAATQIALRS